MAGERIDGEGDKAFAAFVAYRDMGAERSLDAVASGLGKSTALLERWSRLYGWQARIAAWDDALDEERRAAIVEVVKDRAARGNDMLWETATMLHDAITVAVLDRVNADGTPNATAVQWRDFPALTKLYVDTLQLSQNKPTSIQGSTISADQLDKILSSMAEGDRLKVVEGLRILQRAAGE